MSIWILYVHLYTHKSMYVYTFITYPYYILITYLLLHTYYSISPRKRIHTVYIYKPISLSLEINFMGYWVCSYKLLLWIYHWGHLEYFRRVKSYSFKPTRFPPDQWSSPTCMISALGKFPLGVEEIPVPWTISQPEGHVW